MGQIGYGYGSEWHLLRYLGRHRTLLSRLVGEDTGCKDIEWLDFGFDSKDPRRDEEWKGLNFLEPDLALKAAWGRFWPQGAGIHNWDAVARAESGEGPEWILVEAKANIEEVSICVSLPQPSQVFKFPIYWLFK